MPQYAFLIHLRVNVRATPSTHTHSFTWSRICVELSSAVFKIRDQWSVNVSSNLRSEVHCMQSVICSLQSAVCKCQTPEPVTTLPPPEVHSQTFKVILFVNVNPIKISAYFSVTGNLHRFRLSKEVGMHCFVDSVTSNFDQFSAMSHISKWLPMRLLAYFC